MATRNIVAVSDEGDPQQLSMIGVNPITALLPLRLFAPLSEGDWIAQTGANSGVGQYVISLAERAGIHTLNVVRSQEAATQVSDAGGDRVVIDGDDLPAQLQRVLGGHELTLVLDSIGGPVVTNLAHRLRYGGKVVSFGALSGQPTALNVRQDLIYFETPGVAAGPEGFVMYDELRGPDLDAARLPLPTGDEHIPLDPNAELAVGEGEVRVTIPRFSLSHDSFQAVDLAVKNIGGDPGDYRQAMTAFHVFDLDASQRVFAVCGTSTRVLALHEQLGLAVVEQASRSTT